jgi:hypothetical protein
MSALALPELSHALGQLTAMKEEYESRPEGWQANRSSCRSLPAKPISPCASSSASSNALTIRSRFDSSAGCDCAKPANALRTPTPMSRALRWTWATARFPFFCYYLSATQSPVIRWREGAAHGGSDLSMADLQAYQARSGKERHSMFAIPGSLPITDCSLIPRRGQPAWMLATRMAERRRIWGPLNQIWSKPSRSVRSLSRSPRRR